MCAVQACADLNADQANRASLMIGKWTFATPAPSVRVPHPGLCGMKMKRPGGTRKRGVFGVDPEFSPALVLIPSNATSLAG